MSNHIVKNIQAHRPVELIDTKYCVDYIVNLKHGLPVKAIARRFPHPDRTNGDCVVIDSDWIDYCHSKKTKSLTHQIASCNLTTLRKNPFRIGITYLESPVVYDRPLTIDDIHTILTDIQNGFSAVYKRLVNKGVDTKTKQLKKKIRVLDNQKFAAEAKLKKIQSKRI